MPSFSKESQVSSTRMKQKTKDKGKITQEMYDLVMAREKGHCALCSTATWLEVHHAIPRGRGPAEPWNLLALCKECHYVKIHGQGDYETRIKVLHYLMKRYDNMELQKEEYRIKQGGN